MNLVQSKIKTLFLLFVVFLQIEVTAQVEKLDSAIVQLKKATSDSAKLQASFKLPLGSMTPNQCLSVAKLLIAEAELINSKQLLAKGWVSLGYGYYKSGNYAKALEADIKALRIGESSYDPTLMTEIYNNLGLTFQFVDIAKARAYYLKSLEIIRNHSGNWANVTYPNFVRFLLSQNQIDSAIFYSNEYFELSLKHNLKVENSYSYNSVMSDISNANKQPELALVYAKKAMMYAANNKSPYQIMKANLLLAKAHLNKDSAYTYYLKVFADSEQFDFKRDLIVSSNWIYQYYLDNSNIDNAIKFMKVWKSTSDSLDAQNKSIDFQNLAFEEKLREKELEKAAIIQDAERNHNIQLALTAIAILSGIIFFLLLSRSVLVSHKVVAFLSVVVLLVVFEFINLLIHPWLEKITHHSPALMLIALVAIAALIVPLHHKLEHWTTKKLVEKNKAIRLAKAQKTIEELSNPS